MKFTIENLTEAEFDRLSDLLDDIREEEKEKAELSRAVKELYRILGRIESLNGKIYFRTFSAYEDDYEDYLVNDPENDWKLVTYYKDKEIDI